MKKKDDFIINMFIICTARQHDMSESNKEHYNVVLGELLGATTTIKDRFTGLNAGFDYGQRDERNRFWRLTSPRRGEWVLDFFYESTVCRPIDATLGLPLKPTYASLDVQ